MTTPDDRTLHFTPMGLSTSGTLAPASAATFQQEVIAGCDLVDAVPEGTRQSFERLRHLHSYGVLFYDAFTIAGDLAHFVAELALRERFVSYYDHEIPLTNIKTGELRPLQARNYDVVDDALRKGSHRKGDWGLLIEGRKPQVFRGSMADLLAWARDTALLPGQRSRMLDSLWVAMRNSVAHPNFHLFGPVESARSITDSAELINQLWGSPTKNGRLFPAARDRVVRIIAWRPNELVMCGPDALTDLDQPDSWTCAVVRAVADDRNLELFDAQFERTHFPTDLLLGPASVRETIDWAKDADLSPDSIDHLDRLFAIQILDGEASAPRRPEVALGLTTDEREGAWLLVRADHPDEAYGYGRAVAEVDLADAPPATPMDFPTTPLLRADDWSTLARCLEQDFGVDAAVRPPALRVPSWRWDSE